MTETGETRERRCADRIADQWTARLSDFAAILARDDPEEGDDELPGLSEYPLAVNVTRVYAVRIELSTGGPADYITATLESDGTIASAAYHCADWFDHAEQPIDPQEVGPILDAYLDLSALGEYAR